MKVLRCNVFILLYILDVSCFLNVSDIFQIFLMLANYFIFPSTGAYNNNAQHMPGGDLSKGCKGANPAVVRAQFFGIVNLNKLLTCQTSHSAWFHLTFDFFSSSEFFSWFLSLISHLRKRCQI